MCMAIGGPQKYSGDEMRFVHSGMKITEQQWDAFGGEFAVKYLFIIIF